ncbi:MAG: hypothetical protein HFH14_03240 [Lachnospiraceae bacterium]|nr:hypothetical protein [Lachnospiraceae bacterium]
MKKNNAKRIICLTMSALLSFSGAFISSPYAQGASTAKKIIMNKKVLNMKPGETFKLKVKKVKPAKLGNAVQYKSLKKQVASVNSRGVVKALKKGKANIMVVSKKNKSVKAKVTVNVKKAVVNNNNISNTTSVPVQSNTPAPVVSPEPVATPSPAPVTTPAPDVIDGKAFKNTSEIYEAIIAQQFRSMLPGNGGSIIALDIKGCSSLTDSDAKLLTDTLSSKYCETVIKTKEELVEEGKIVDDDVNGFVFKDGVLITIIENSSDSNSVTFDIRCTKSGLNGVFFKECKAVFKDGGWMYTLGTKGLS